MALSIMFHRTGTNVLDMSSDQQLGLELGHGKVVFERQKLRLKIEMII